MKKQSHAREGLNVIGFIKNAPNMNQLFIDSAFWMKSINSGEEKMEKNYIAINHWQNYLSLSLRGIKDFPEWKAVNPRNFRYGNAQNVCLWSQEMEDFLKRYDINYSVRED